MCFASPATLTAIQHPSTSKTILLMSVTCIFVISRKGITAERERARGRCFRQSGGLNGRCQRRRQPEGFDTERLVDLLGVVDHPVLHHELDLTNRADVFRRVTGYQEKVGSLATLQAAIQLIARQ